MIKTITQVEMKKFWKKIQPRAFHYQTSKENTYLNPNRDIHNNSKLAYKKMMKRTKE